MAELRTSGETLRQAIERAGYYPGLVSDALETALAGEAVRSFVVHHEPHFDREELRRHVSVLVLTPTRLVVGHSDDYPADEASPQPYASVSTEAVPLRRVTSVVISRTVTDPVAYRAGEQPSDVVLSVGWGTVGRIDLEPASCADPECEADHGYTGAVSSDDFSLRVSAVAEGGQVVAQVLRFARDLSGATASDGPGSVR